MRLPRDLSPAVTAAAPWTAAILTLAAGVMLLASGATPSEPERFVAIMEFEPVLLIEIGHFLSSILGLVLVMLAFGLRARLGGAWGTTMIVVLVAAPLSLVKGFIWEESALLGLLAALLAPFRSAFPRTSRLTRMEVTPGWLVSAFALVVGAGALGLWSFEHADYGDRAWWQVMADADAARSLRAWAGAAILLFGFGVWRLFASAATPTMTGSAPSWPRPRSAGPPPTWPCWATSASCSRLLARAS